jgi:hypothetical protein
MAPDLDCSTDTEQPLDVVAERAALRERVAQVLDVPVEEVAPRTEG